MDTKISNLTADTNPATTDVMPIVNGGASSTQKITLATLIAFFASTVRTLTNALFDTAGTGNTFKINGNAVSAVTGTGATVALASKPTFVGTVQTISVMSAQAVDGSLGSVFTRTLAGNETFTQSNFSTGQFFLVKVKQGSGTSYTVTWFSTITWITSGGTAPVQTSTSNGYTTYGIECTGSNTFDGYLVSTQ